MNYFWLLLIIFLSLSTQYVFTIVAYKLLSKQIRRKMQVSILLNDMLALWNMEEDIKQIKRQQKLSQTRERKILRLLRKIEQQWWLIR